MLSIKICSIQYPERYVLRRMVLAAQQELLPRFPGLELEIQDLADPSQIGKYALVLVLPTLVINETVVCSGRFPSKEEVRDWLAEAVVIDARKGA